MRPVYSISDTFLTSNRIQTAGNQANSNLRESCEEPSGGQVAPSIGHRCTLPQPVSLSVYGRSKTFLIDQPSLLRSLSFYILFCTFILKIIYWLIFLYFFFPPVYCLSSSALVSSHGPNHPGVLAHFIASSSCLLYFCFFGSDVFTFLNFAVFVISCCRNVDFSKTFPSASVMEACADQTPSILLLLLLTTRRAAPPEKSSSSSSSSWSGC